MSATKDVNDLVRAIKATGTHNVLSNGSHYKVVDGAGNTIVTMPKTPSDKRWRENAVHDLIRNGVLESDPKKRRNRGHSRLSDPDVQAAKVAAVKARAARLAEETAVVRERLQPLVNKIGGWGMKQGEVTSSEVGLVAMYWGRDREDVFKTEGAARSSAQTNMRHGGACAPQALAFWDAFVTAWELADDPRSWYFDLAREMKGLAPIEKKVIVGGAEAVQAGGKKPRAGRVKTYKMERHPLEPTPIIGELAMKAVMLMAAGRDLSDKADQDQILEVGEQIAALEALAQEEEE